MIFAGGVLFAAQRGGIGISGGSGSQFDGDGPLGATSDMGQSRHSDHAPITSGLPPSIN
jgi:hypothetical protein